MFVDLSVSMGLSFYYSCPLYVSWLLVGWSMIPCNKTFKKYFLYKNIFLMLLWLASGALAFDMDYARWLDEHQRLINDLRSAVSSNMGDNELRHLVDGVMGHYDEVFQLKSIGTKADVFHMLSGMWKTPAERCFMWLGGFRSSEILKVINC